MYLEEILHMIEGHLRAISIAVGTRDNRPKEPEAETPQPVTGDQNPTGPQSGALDPPPQTPPLAANEAVMPDGTQVTDWTLGMLKKRLTAEGITFKSGIRKDDAFEMYRAHMELQAQAAGQPATDNKPGMTAAEATDAQAAEAFMGTPPEPVAPLTAEEAKIQLVDLGKEYLPLKLKEIVVPVAMFFVAEIEPGVKDLTKLDDNQRGELLARINSDRGKQLLADKVAEVGGAPIPVPPQNPMNPMGGALPTPGGG